MLIFIHPHLPLDWSSHNCPCPRVMHICPLDKDTNLDQIGAHHPHFQMRLFLLCNEEEQTLCHNGNAGNCCKSRIIRKQNNFLCTKMVYNRDEYSMLIQQIIYATEAIHSRKLILNKQFNEFSLESVYTLKSTSSFCYQVNFFFYSFNSSRRQTQILAITSNMPLIVIYFLASQNSLN